MTRAVEERGEPSTIDMKPIASLAPTVSITVSPIAISITPDCTMYMQAAGVALVEHDGAYGELDVGADAARDLPHIDVFCHGLPLHNITPA